MLRVSKVEDWVNRPPARREPRSSDDCVIIRAAGDHRSGASSTAGSGVSGASAGARALGLNLVLMPPGSRGMPHYHDGHEIALYLVSGETEVWYGTDLAKRSTVRAGDFIYIPPGTPHLAVNRGDVTSIAVVARTDPDDDGRTVVIELPRHLASLLSLPIAIQE